VTRESWGESGEGPVTLFTLWAGGMRARVLDFGATLVSLELGDGEGGLTDVVLGFDDLGSYLRHDLYFGATVGRYANRIANAVLSIEGVRHELTVNHGRHHLHAAGGARQGAVARTRARRRGRVGVELRALSRDGEEGYPGNLDCRVTYTLSDEGALSIEYQATTDRRRSST